jgi:hypothetical protein
MEAGEEKGLGGESATASFCCSRVRFLCVNNSPVLDIALLEIEKYKYDCPKLLGDGRDYRKAGKTFFIPWGKPKAQAPGVTE